MADILRGPLVYRPQQKRPIAPVDYFSRPLTLVPAPPATLDLPLRSGRLFDSAPPKRWQPDPLQSQGLIAYDGPEAAIASLSDSAPQRRKSISLEQVTNLLTNTLGQATLGLPLSATRLDISAPRRAGRLSLDVQCNSIVLGEITMPLRSARIDFSAPPNKRQVRIEALYRPLTLGINPNAAVVQLSDSATPQKRSAYSFDPPNLLGTTLQSAQAQLSLPLSAMRADAPAPAVKYQVRTESLSRPLTLGINPNAEVGSITESAPPPKRAAYAFDPPNLLLATLAEPLGLPITAGRVDASAPILKYQVRVESLSRPVTLGVNPNAAIAQLSTSAPPPKKAAYTFDPPNLIATTLAEPLDLPRLAVRIDWSAPPRKAAAYLEEPANTLIIAPGLSDVGRQRVSNTRVVFVGPSQRIVVLGPSGSKLH